MAITFRANKGSALTYTELDQNFGQYFYSSSVDVNGTLLRLHYTGSANVPINASSHTISLVKVTTLCYFEDQIGAAGGAERTMRAGVGVDSLKG